MQVLEIRLFSGAMSTSNEARTSLKRLKPVVITGASSGIGLATAQTLLKTGEYHVVTVSRPDEALRAALLESLPAERGERKSSDYFTIFECDLRDAEATRKTAERILAVHSEPYALINNAGVYPFGGIENTTESQWDETFSVNLKAAFLLAQALVPGLKRSADGARIVNVSSTAGLLPNHFALAYSVSKAALIQFTRTLAKELGKDRITVNCVCPGIVRSAMHESYHRNETELESFYAKRGAAFPAGRVGEPTDVAGAIEYFLSPKASWITGDVLVIDGGRLLL